MTTVDELRVQHKMACDKIVQRLETKSSRGEGPSRVLRKILKHFDKTDGQMMLTADEFVMAMERIGTKLTPSDLDLLLTVYSVDGTGFDGHRFAADLFGEGGHHSSMIVESGITGGVFSQDNTPRSAPKQQRQSANYTSMPGGPLINSGPMANSAPMNSAPMTERDAPPSSNGYPQTEIPSFDKVIKKQSNQSSIPGGIFGAHEPEVYSARRGGGRTNQSSIPGGVCARAGASAGGVRDRAKEGPRLPSLRPPPNHGSELEPQHSSLAYPRAPHTPSMSVAACRYLRLEGAREVVT
jgi:hypothetical protein